MTWWVAGDEVLLPISLAFLAALSPSAVHARAARCYQPGSPAVARAQREAQAASDEALLRALAQRGLVEIGTRTWSRELNQQGVAEGAWPGPNASGELANDDGEPTWFIPLTGAMIDGPAPQRYVHDSSGGVFLLQAAGRSTREPRSFPICGCPPCPPSQSGMYKPRSVADGLAASEPVVSRQFVGPVPRGSVYKGPITVEFEFAVPQVITPWTLKGGPNCPPRKCRPKA